MDNQDDSGIIELGLKSDIINSKFNMEEFKRHLISAGITFISAFLLVLSMAIVDNSFTFSQEALLAVSYGAIIAGVRAIAKLIIEWHFGRVS